VIAQTVLVEITTTASLIQNLLNFKNKLPKSTTKLFLTLKISAKWTSNF